MLYCRLEIALAHTHTHTLPSYAIIKIEIHALRAESMDRVECVKRLVKMIKTHAFRCPINFVRIARSSLLCSCRFPAMCRRTLALDLFICLRSASRSAKRHLAHNTREPACACLEATHKHVNPSRPACLRAAPALLSHRLKILITVQYIPNDFP